MAGNRRSRAKALLFPARSRFFPGQRWVNIALRCGHLVGIAGLAGGFLFGVEAERWLPFWYLTLATGGGLVGLYVYSNAAWLLQLKGMVVVLKVGLLAVAYLFPAWRGALFVAVILLSGLIAHAPGRVRGWGWRPGADA